MEKKDRIFKKLTEKEKLSSKSLGLRLSVEPINYEKKLEEVAEATGIGQAVHLRLAVQEYLNKYHKVLTDKSS